MIPRRMVVEACSSSWRRVSAALKLAAFMAGHFNHFAQSFTVECHSCSQLLIRFPVVTASGYRIQETKWFRVGATPFGSGMSLTFARTMCCTAA